MKQEKGIDHAVKKEYINIEEGWMKLHLTTHAILICCAIIAELAMFFILTFTQFEDIDPTGYVFRYVLAPSAANIALALTSFFLCYKTKLPRLYKFYIVSLSFALSAFIISVVHCLFSAIYVVFVIPLIMTTIYGSQRITAATFGTCIALTTISSTFFEWDTSKNHDAYYFINTVACIFIVTCVYVACIVIISYEKKKYQVMIEYELERDKLQIELFRDDLTGVQNKLAFRDIMNKVETSGAEMQYFLAMFDLDNFKQVNDRCGHLKGDELLREFGSVLNRLADENAFPFRFGGDEFSILYDNVQLERVIENAKEIQSAFNGLSHPEFEGLKVTLSAGIAGFHRGMTAHQLIENADEALYQSKTLSKNRISIYSDERGYKSSYLAKKQQNT